MHPAPFICLTGHPRSRRIPSDAIGIGGRGCGRVLGAFLIFLREGIEGSMLVAILLAYLRQIKRPELARDVYLGVGLALVLAFGGGVAVFVTFRYYDGTTLQTVFETVTYFLATAVLTYMTFWMRAQSRSLGRDLHAQADAALGGGSRWALGLIAFQAVGREGLESVVFLLAIALGSSALQVSIGAAAGITGALVVANMMYRVGARLNLGRFFAWTGALLLLVAAGLLADAVENMQSLGWVHILGHPLWTTKGVLSEASMLGDILHTFFGYAAQPTGLQVLAYAFYVLIVLWFLRGGRPGRKRSATV